jgi:hypothetical protein
MTTPRAATLAEVHEVVVALADDVEQRWHDRADDEAFARAATDALAAAVLPTRLPAGAALTYLAAWPGLPPVVAGENEYGEPTVTVWRSADFHIEMIVWSLGAIALHDHVNAGAFVPLVGRRFHTRYDFTPTGTWADRFTVGRLRLRQGEILGPGDARGILPGTAFLHDLVFCAERCTTISVRRRASTGDSAAYLAPGIRLPNVAIAGRRVRGLQHLRQTDHRAWSRAVDEMVSQGPDTALLSLLELCSVLAPRQLGPVVRRVVDRWGGDLEWWADVVAEIVRRHRLEQLVPAAEPDARLALAALRSGIDGAAAADLGVDRGALLDDEHGTVARSRAALGWS